MEFLKKWYTYQKERFPILVYGLYCFCIVFGTFCFCNYCAEIDYMELLENGALFFADLAPRVINYWIMFPMFIVGFLLFLIVRIIDEFKDYKEDCKYRPYRPVPRGLITLKELKILFFMCAILQVIITFFISPVSLIFLVFVWGFLALMTKGFFIKKILDKHILLEVALDELLLPVSVIYLSHFITYVNPTYSFYSYLNLSELLPFLIITYIISWIVEIARKVRCKEKEEEGVKTYTAVFGIFRATILLWTLEIMLFGIITWIIGVRIYIAIVFAIISILNLLFIIKKNQVLSKCVEYSADSYVMMCLVSLAFLL